ncbi:MAG: helix-turn-helix domain-containing protein [Bacteroidota bacterium]
MKIPVKLEKTRTGFSAYAEKYPVYSVGKTMDQLKARMVEALNLYFEKRKKVISEKDLRFMIDLPQLFECYTVINAKALAERIGMHQSLLAQYIHGHKRPSALQLTRILKGVQQVGRELNAIRILT